MAETKKDAGVEVWAYCLMPNHVHLVVVPEQEDSLSRLFRCVHRHYSRYINFREKWKGHLWQERFHSFVMDESHLLAAVKYTELNPVRAKLCHCPEEWRWSSADAHLQAKDDSVVTVKPMLDRIDNWSEYLSIEEHVEELAAIRQHGRTGRPAGSNIFVEGLETLTGKMLKKRKPGPKPRVK